MGGEGEREREQREGSVGGKESFPCLRFHRSSADGADECARQGMEEAREEAVPVRESKRWNCTWWEEHG